MTDLISSRLYDVFTDKMDRKLLPRQEWIDIAVKRALCSRKPFRAALKEIWNSIIANQALSYAEHKELEQAEALLHRVEVLRGLK